MSTDKIKYFDSNDESTLIERLSKGDAVGAIAFLDKLLDGADDANIDTYLLRIVGIVNCLIKCAFPLNEERQYLVDFIKALKNAAVYEDIYNIICREIQNICSCATTSRSLETKDFVILVEEFVQHNYMNNATNVDYIARKLNCSINNLNRKFRAVRNMTLGEYLSNYRIKMVKDEIILGNSMQSIAENCGYSSVRTLNRAFKKTIGITPSEYKKLKTAEFIKNNIEYKYKFQNALDYAKGICDTIMKQHIAKYLPPCSFYFSRRVSLFSYPQGFFLHGMMKLYHLTGEDKYLNYAKAWVDSVLDENGNIRTFSGWASLDSLDFRQPGVLLLDIYKVTKDKKYLKLAKYLVESLDDYPKNGEGGFNHFVDTVDIMWLGDAYMAGPTCAKYAKYANKPEYLDVAIEQIEVMWNNMRDKDGLLRHGWDYSKKANWADRSAGLSPVVWSRALGFYMASVVDILDYVPRDHAKRAALEQILTQMMPILIKYQSADGRWYQIVDKPMLKGNWIEFSGTCLLLYSMAKAYRKGYTDKKYLENIKKTYAAIIESVDVSKDGSLLMKNISSGVDFGSIGGYIKGKTNLNDLRGAGAFALMCIEISQIDLE